jgi:hypothetical protein
MGPNTRPRFPTNAQEKIIHVRACILNMSSILQATMTVGMADRMPVINLATTIAAMEGTAAAITQKTQYKQVDMT